ncbi:MAG: hypothetical protein KIT09_23555 [Bryobacteraceae bacterium]|nr:hypothetical protein [Bryobacteraceae bacterium]
MPGAESPSDILAAIQDFLRASRQPAILEPGEEPLPLMPDSFHLEVRGARVLLQAWDEKRNIARRVSALDQQARGKLTLRVDHFGGRQGSVLLFDQARPSNIAADRKAARMVFRETFRRFLRRQFLDWKLVALSSDADLEHSLSPTYPRAYLTSGSRGWAAIAAPADPGAAAGILTYGLVWLDYLRKREKRTYVEGLALFVPEGQQRATCLRLGYLDRQTTRFSVYVYQDGFEEEIDPRDHGNLETRLETCQGTTAPVRHGEPESWLESQVRAHLATIDPDLLAEPVYGQVPAFAGGERDVIDLLAVERRGRLAVLELKASAEPHLPLQALDYWMRVEWHAARNEFGARGYFRDRRLSAAPPRLVLIAPALEFHPTTETILRYFDPRIPVERIGVGMQWRDRLQVAFRIQGSAKPGMGTETAVQADLTPRSLPPLP